MAGISSELKVLFTKDYLNSSELNESKGLIQLDAIVFETHCRPSDHKAICLVNSVDPFESVRSTGSSINSKPNKLRIETDSESGCEELSVIETPGLWLNLMDEVNRFSGHYLVSQFLEQSVVGNIN